MNSSPRPTAAPLSRRDFSRFIGSAALAALASRPVCAASRKSEPTVGLAIGTYGMKDLATADALRLIKETGYDGVQLALMPGWPADPAKLSAEGRKTLRRQIEDSGLALPSLLESIPLTGTPDARSKNLDRLKRAVELGVELASNHPPYLDTILGRKTADWDKVKDAMVDELRAWMPVLEAGKTTLVFKPHIGHAVHSPERSLWLIQAVGSPRLRIVFDYSHFFVEGFPLEGSVRQLFAYSPFFVVKDSAGVPGKYEYLLPGDGQTDYLAYFRLLKQLGYSGFVNVEVSGHIQRKPDYQPVPTTKLCYTRLAPLMEQAGLVRPPTRSRS